MYCIFYKFKCNAQSLRFYKCIISLKINKRKNKRFIMLKIINTFKYAIVEEPFSIAIALILAVFLNGKIKEIDRYMVNYRLQYDFI